MMMRVPWWREGTAFFLCRSAEGSFRAPTGQGGRRRGGALAPGLGALLMVTLAALICPHAAFASGGGDVDPFVYRFTVFVIAIFVGYYVVWSVTPALHTPLMSVTNAISSVIVVGALLAVGVSLAAEGSRLAKVFGFLALTMASVNIFGGFLVTQRMLGMYKKRDAKK
jgi:H+-translocating NAD(P) transhydrogenase subunit alpha